MERINVHNARSLALTQILVIEDDPLLAAGLARVSNRRGNAVSRAAVGIQATT
jgi:ActR/RegA family two-component response regulator